MAEWSTKSIGEVCDLVTGGTPSRARPEFFGGEIPWLVSGDINRGEIRECEGRITKTGMSSCNAKILPKDSVMIALNGQGKTRGTVALLRMEATCNQSLVCISPKDRSALLPEFLYVNLHGRYEELRRLTSDDDKDRRGLNMGIIREIKVPIPPICEQRRVVTILEEAFEVITTARAHAEKNLQNAHAIFETHLQSVFSQRDEGWVEKSFGELADFRNGINFTQSSAGDPVNILGVKDFRNSYWAPLDNLEQVTPDGALSALDMLQRGDIVFVRSNGNPELIGRCLLIGDVSERTTHSGFTIRARLRGTGLSPTYLCHFLKSKHVRKEMVDGGNGANIKSLNQGTLSRLVIPMPAIEIQERIVAQLEALSTETKRLESIYQRKVTALDALKKSLLYQAFSGQLTSTKQASVLQQSALQTTTPEFTANVISFAYARHERKKREKTFGHVKEQKVLHLVESIAGIDLGRQPMRNAAGPNDFAHMLKAEEWAKAHGFFEVAKRDGGYEFKKLSAFDEHMSRARQALAPYLPQLESVLDLLVPMDTAEAEVFATVHAAWNNLLIDGMEVTDDTIVSAARDDWHADKLKIPEHKFRTAIALIRQKNLVPDGSAKYVGDQHRLI